jgi:DNA-binding NarL/FixJ family response regulator
MCQDLSRINVLVMTASESLDHLTEALRAGASGYILKTAPPQQITDAIRRVLEGESPLNQEVAMRLLVNLLNEKRGRQELEAAGPVPEALSQHQPTPAALERKLSPREVEVLRLVAQGHTNQQVAKELLLSTSTVKNHVQQILSKLGVSDRTQAAIMASKLGLLCIALGLCLLVECF